MLQLLSRYSKPQLSRKFSTFVNTCIRVVERERNIQKLADQKRKWILQNEVATDETSSAIHVELDNCCGVDSKWISRYSVLYDVLNDFPLLKKISMADVIMFNQSYRVEYSAIERYLSLCRFSQVKHLDILLNGNMDAYYIIDGWHIRYTPRMHHIYYNNHGVGFHPFAQVDLEKFIVAQTLLRIMNRTENKHLNFYNYAVLGRWYLDNLSFFQQYEEHFGRPLLKEKNIYHCRKSRRQYGTFWYDV